MTTALSNAINPIEEFDYQLKHYDFLVAGKNNPYNYVGQQHNECVDYVSKKVDSVNAKKLVATAFDFMRMNDGGFIKEFDSSFEEKIYVMCDSLLTDIEKSGEVNPAIIDALKLNPTIKFEFQWLLFSILTFDPSRDTLIDKMNELNVWEQRILNSKYSQDDTTPLLIASAVARHSIKYWTDNLDLTETEGKANRKKKCLRAVFIVCADVVGAVGGAVAGTIAGGPVGGVAGGIAASGAMSAGAGLIFR